MQSYPSFQLFRVNRPKRLEYVTCGHVFFSKTEGKIVRSQKYPDTCQRGQKNHRSRAFDSLFDHIPTVHPYLPFQKYPDTCERRLKTHLSRAFYSIFFSLKRYCRLSVN